MPTMDFRDNWFAHFKAAVDKECEDCGGLPAAYAAVALKLEMSRDTIYQHYKQKSKKVYPTVEMMVMLEKKYANGRPIGWASQPISESRPGATQPEQGKVRNGKSLFSQDVERAVEALQPEGRRIVEGVIRAALDLPLTDVKRAA